MAKFDTSDIRGPVLRVAGDAAPYFLSPDAGEASSPGAIVPRLIRAQDTYDRLHEALTKASAIMGCVAVSSENARRGELLGGDLANAARAARDLAFGAIALIEENADLFGRGKQSRAEGGEA